MPVVKQRDLSFTQNRELSWLKFNERVLAQAMDPGLPLMERLRFVSIFTSNLDEFFMVRVGSLIDMDMLAPEEKENKSGMTPKQQVSAICTAVVPLIQRRDDIYRTLMNELDNAGVTEASYDTLTAAQKVYVQDYYKENIRPLLSPQVIDRSHPFPHLKNKALYAAALLTLSGKTQGKQAGGKQVAVGKQTGGKQATAGKHESAGKQSAVLGIVDVPPSLPRVIMLPGGGVRYIRTETVIAAHMKKIFKIYDVGEQAVISITRNADISLSEEHYDDENPDFLNYMRSLLKKRDRLAPVRLELEGKAPRLAKRLCEFLKLDAERVFSCECPLVIDYVDHIERTPKALFNAPHAPVYPDYLNADQSVWEQIVQRDVLLFYPYQSMQPFLDLLRQSARDPNVVSIKITIYRLARNSAIAKALCAAAENGKEVTVLMELRARFDEQNNIDWSMELEEAGCRIIYGPENLKCHAKLCLITRRERGGLGYIAQIGTGNYNEKTSTLYTDFCMMTADPVITRDAVNFFENMLIGNSAGEYEKLLVAPFAMKNRIMEMIDEQIARGSAGRIRVKANSVTDRELIDKLSEASCAGVRVDLVIRGICCLTPGVPGKTENITVTSVVGRFLEHSRIYAFGEGPEMKLYLSSADFMTRNQDRRVEVGGPVRSPELKQFLEEYLGLLLADNTRAWRQDAEGIYTRLHPDGAEPIDVQAWYLSHPIEFEKSVQRREKLKDRVRRAVETVNRRIGNRKGSA
ncbi:MAG: polyphosphate kinase 1 [Clostridia bacterium]|nr:polyphosphate kinase 1 [Clostridia bacterium]